MKSYPLCAVVQPDEASGARTCRELEAKGAAPGGTRGRFAHSSETLRLFHAEPGDDSCTQNYARTLVGTLVGLTRRVLELATLAPYVDVQPL